VFEVGEYVITKDGEKLDFDELLKIMDGEITTDMLDNDAFYATDQQFYDEYCRWHSAIYIEDFDPHAKEPYTQDDYVLNETITYIDFGLAESLMDKSLYEQVRADNMPCDKYTLFYEYCRRHKEKFGEDFGPNLW
jgi:hypothetical protein